MELVRKPSSGGKKKDIIHLVSSVRSSNRFHNQINNYNEEELGCKKGRFRGVLATAYIFHNYEPHVHYILFEV